MMTSKNHESTDWPAPLRTKGNRLGQAVREFVRDTGQMHGEAPACAPALVQRCPRRLPRYLPAAAGVALTLVLVTVGAVLYRRGLPATGPGVAGPPQPTHAPSPASKTQPSAQPTGLPGVVAARTTTIRLTSSPASLPSGRVDLLGQATVLLSADAVASGRMQAEDTEISLGKGKIDLDVLPRAPGHEFSVRAGRYRFTVLGTSFTVMQTRSRLELLVKEGTVAVWRGERRLTTVHAGQGWATELSSDALSGMSPVDVVPSAVPAPVRTDPPSATVSALAPPAAAEPAPLPAASAPPPAPEPKVTVPAPVVDPSRGAPTMTATLKSCGELAAGKRTASALACYQENARQGGLAGETAQYELARLWRDSLGQPEHALASFKEQRSRFPSGALRIEADLSIIELLPRLGRHAEAMAESEQFLAAHPRAERRGELRLLRGNILRVALHDVGRAEREYLLGSEAGGRIGDDCRYLHAVCLETLGRTEEARKEYRAYLLQRGAAHIQEVKKHLEGLGQ
jgi:hypothetical protein